MVEGSGLPSGIVTFAFTDIEGSTRLLRRLGDRYSPLLDRHLALMDEAWQAHGGHLIGTAGDGVFLAFQHADDAVNACADAQRRLSRNRGRRMARSRCAWACTPASPRRAGTTTAPWRSTRPRG